MIDIFLNVLTLTALAVGSYTDLKRREVPDWISYGLIFAALGTRLLYSIFTSEKSFFLTSLFGFAAVFLVANAMYFLRQWGGGDAKILMGMGAVLGFNVSLLIFIFLWIFSGAIYGVCWSIYLALQDKVRFKRTFNAHKKDFGYLWHASIIIFILGIISLFILPDKTLALLIFAISALFFLGIFSFLFVHSVEESSLLQRVKSSKLTEGDWIAETIRINGKTIVTEKTMGITKEQIQQLKNYNKDILVKIGIPFIPVFLLAFISLLLLKNAILGLIL